MSNKFIRYSIYFLISFIFLDFVCYDMGFTNNRNLLYAQRRRKSTTKRTPRVKKTSGSEMEVDILQLQSRNRDLLREIINLKSERDFYKKKLLEWSETQKTEPEKPIETINIPEKQRAEVKIPYSPQPGKIYVMQKPDTVFVPIKLKKSYEDSLFTTGKRYVLQENYNDALATFELLKKSKACADNHRLEYGKLLYKLGDFSKAIDVLSAIAENDSLVSIASFFKGRAHQEIGSFHIAEVELLRSRILNKKFPGYYVGMGFDLIEKNQLDSAEVLFNSQLDVSDILEPEIFAGLADISRLKNNRQKAISLYKKSLVYDPGYMKSNFNMGILLLEEMQYQPAILFLSKSMKFDRCRRNYHFYLGQAYYYMRKWDSALSEFLKTDEAIWGREDKIEWVPKAYYLKSLMTREEGNFHDATNYFRRAKEWNPDAYSWMSEALKDLGQIYENETNYTNALSYYSKFIRLNPNDADSMMKLGILYLQNGDIDAARAAFINASHFKETISQSKYWLDQIKSAEE